MSHRIEHAWLIEVAPAGLVAGLAVIAAEMLLCALEDGTDGFIMPIRMIAALVLGRRALVPTYDLSTVLVVGTVVHSLASVLFGLLFIVLAQPTSIVPSKRLLLFKACLFGLTLWLVNVHIVAPIVGWRWFAARSVGVAPLVAHALFYGGTLGVYICRHAAAPASVLD